MRTIFFLLCATVASGVFPGRLLAAMTTCATGAKITAIDNGAYADPKSWGVYYMGLDGATHRIKAERYLDTPEGRAMWDELSDAMAYGGAVTFFRNQPTCAGDTGDWFDHIIVER